MNAEETELMKQLFNKISQTPKDECNTDLVNRVQDIEEAVDIFERKLNSISSNSLDGKKDAPKLSKIWGSIGGINKNIEKLKKVTEKMSDPVIHKQIVKEVDTFTNSDAHNQLLDDFNAFKRRYESFKDEERERFVLIEKWIIADTNKEKCIIKKEIEDNRKQALYLDTILSAGKEIEPKDGWENVETSHLEIGVRSITMLIKNNIDTLGELVQHDEEFYLSQPNYGRTSLEDLKKAIKTYGITLKKKNESKDFKL